MGLVRDLNSKMSQIPPLFNDNKQLDESELVNSLAKTLSRSHKAMMISQGFNPEIGDLVTFVEHYERAYTTDNIAMAKISASDEDSDTMKNKRCPKKTKERGDSGKKHRKNASLYCSLHGENNGHTLRECKILKSRAAEKDKYKYGNKDYKNKFTELNLLQAEANHQKSKYEELNKSFKIRKIYEEETINLAESLDSNSSSSRESNNYSTRTGKKPIAYDSYSSDES